MLMRFTLPTYFMYDPHIWRVNLLSTVIERDVRQEGLFSPDLFNNLVKVFERVCYRQERSKKILIRSADGRIRNKTT